MFTLPADSLKGIGGTVGGAATDVFKDTAKLLADLSKVVKDVTLPVFKELAKVLDATLMPPLKAVGKAFADAGKAVGDGLKWVGSAMSGFGSAASDTAKAFGAGTAVVAAAAAAFSGGLVPALAIGGVAVTAFGKAVGREFPGAVAAAGSALRAVANTLATAVSALSGFGSRASDTAKAFGAIGLAAAGLGSFLSGGLLPGIALTGAAVVNLGKLFAKEFPGVVSALAPVANATRNAFGAVADAAMKGLKALHNSSVGRYFEGIGSAVTGALQKLGEGLADKAKSLLDKLPIGGGGYRAGGTPGGAVGNALATVGDAAKPVMNVMGGLAKSFGAITGIAAGVGSAIGGLVEKANPAVFQQFELALNDTMAVIGQALVPVMRVFTDILRMAGDTLTTFAKDLGAMAGTVLTALMPVFKVVFELFGSLGQMAASVLGAVSPALSALGEAFLSIVKAVQPVIKVLIDVVGGVLGTVFGQLGNVIQTITPYIAAFAQVVGDMVATVIGWVRDLLVWIGVLDGKEAKPGMKEGSSVGAAARSANISSVADTIAQAQKASYSLGVASAADPKLVVGKSIDGKVTEVIAAIKSLPRDIANAIANGASGLAEEAGYAITDTLGLTSEEGRKAEKAALAAAQATPGGKAAKDAGMAALAAGKDWRTAANEAMAAFLARRDDPGGGGVVTGMDP